MNPIFIKLKNGKFKVIKSVAEFKRFVEKDNVPENPSDVRYTNGNKKPISFQESGRVPQILTLEQIDKLQTFCRMPIKYFNFPGWKKYQTPHGVYYHLDRGSKVLAMAHLDTVQEKRPFVYDVKEDGTEVLYSPQLDDRLGAWAILDPLYYLGFDILLTEGEEVGQSTAYWFKESFDRRYNWMFEFDRKGTDVVMYQYHSPRMKNLLESFDFEVGHGSCSDISYLEKLECKGFNFGIGYHNNHSMQAYAIMKDTMSMINKFKIFYRELKDVKLWHRISGEREIE